MKVWTFEQINNVLKVAGEGKCREAQACLEGKLLIKNLYRAKSFVYLQYSREVPSNNQIVNISAENQDPMVNVMGAAYASVSSSDRPLLKAHADLSKAREDSSENFEEQEARFTLSLLISEMDKQLLVSSHNTIAKYVYC